MLATLQPYWFGTTLCLVTVLCWLYGYQLYQQAWAPMGGPQSAIPEFREAASPRSSNPDADVVLGAQPGGVFQFIQVSDIHISRYHQQGGIVHFGHFLQTAVPLISPSLVVATGDLTDAKDEGQLRSNQHAIEWQAYQAVLQRSGVLARRSVHGGRFWYDMRGNHDCYNVPTWSSAHNYYRQYAVGRDQPGFTVDLVFDYGRYALIAVDACPPFGLSRPLNFFGYLDRSALDRLARRLAHAKDQPANHTFVFSHYPTSTTTSGTTSQGHTLRTLLQSTSVYLCGHLHELALGLGKRLQTYQAADRYLELELTDLKLHATYRVVAVDHDLIAVKDVPLPLPHIPASGRLADIMSSEPMEHGSANVQLPDPIPAPPVVLATNPKDARYVVPGKEPTYRLRWSTHIRFLAWSSFPLRSVTLRVDGQLLANSATPTGHTNNSTLVSRIHTPKANFVPLWTAPWNPQQWDDGRSHILNITVEDTQGHIGYDTVLFRVDGQREPLHNAGRGGWIMATDFNWWLRLWMGLGYLFLLVLLLLIPKCVGSYYHATHSYPAWRTAQARALRRCDRSSRAQYYQQSTLHSPTRAAARYFIARMGFAVQVTAFRLVEMSQVKRIFYPLYAYCLYLVVGPWFIGTIIPAAVDTQPELATGWFYIHGVYINHRWLPTSDTWFYAMVTMFLPIVLLPYYLALCTTSPRWIYARDNARRQLPYHRRWYVRLLVFGFYVYRMTAGMAVTAYMYGWQTILWGPAQAWIVLYAGYLLWRYDWWYVFSKRSRDATLEAFHPILPSASG
ncbi:hypothetical protein H4R35_003215, partial [Dimargaris xerosporica]